MTFLCLKYMHYKEVLCTSSTLSREYLIPHHCPLRWCALLLILQLAVIPIAIGMGLAWYGEMQVSLTAFGVSLLCVGLQAAKTVIWGEMLTGDFKV